jgi:hypothetical protein
MDDVVLFTLMVLERFLISLICGDGSLTHAFVADQKTAYAFNPEHPESITSALERAGIARFTVNLTVRCLLSSLFVPVISSDLGCRS